MLDPATGEWSDTAPTATVQYAAAVGVMDGKFYVAGGADAADYCLSSADVLDYMQIQ